MSKKKKLHYGYWIVASCCLTVLTVSLGVSCIGLFYAPAAESFGASPAVMSYYMTLMFLVALVIMPFGGKLFNTLDARVLMSVGSLSIGLDLLICSFASAPWMFWVGGALGGIGNAILLTLAPAIMINRWFSKRSGFFIALVMIFTGIGAVVFSPIIGSLLNSIGWELTLRICAVAALIFGLPVSMFVIRSRPSDKGLLPYGAEEATSSANEPVKQELTGIEARCAYKMPGFYALCLFTISLSLVLYTQSMNPNYIKALDISQTAPMLFSVVASFLMGAQIISKLVLGAVGEKRPFIAGCITLVIGMAGFAGNILFANSEIGLIFSGCLIGIVTALMTVLLPIITRYIFGMKEYGEIYSKIATVMTVGGILQAPLLGTLLEMFGWVALETTFIVLCGVAFIALIACSAFGKKSQKATAASSSEAQATEG